MKPGRKYNINYLYFLKYSFILKTLFASTEFRSKTQTSQMDRSNSARVEVGAISTAFTQA